MGGNSEGQAASLPVVWQVGRDGRLPTGPLFYICAGRRKILDTRRWEDPRHQARQKEGRAAGCCTCGKPGRRESSWGFLTGGLEAFCPLEHDEHDDVIDPVALRPENNKCCVKFVL